MTQLYLHPGIVDYFVEYDFNAVQASPKTGGPEDLRRRLMEDYVTEKIILLRNVKIEYDRDFIRNVKFPADWVYKKFSSNSIERSRPIWIDRTKQNICKDLFQGNMGLYSKFRQELIAVNSLIRQVLDEILSAYNVIGRDIVWRHTETRVENLHFDKDKGSDSFESVRLYFNMDDAPRIWNTSHPLSQILTGFYDELELASAVDLPLERLLQLLSVRLFGNWSSRGREQFPHHVVLFEPNDIWICDGRTVPHQVIYGRRVISSFYKLDVDSLPAWHPSLGGRVREVHQTREDGRRQPWSAESLRGYVYPFGAKGPEPPPGVAGKSLKESWAEIYQESIQDRIVRL